MATRGKLFHMVAAPHIEHEDTGGDLARWLQEAGRRKSSSQLPEGQGLPPSPEQPPARAPSKVPPATLRLALMLCALCAAYLQYYYMGVMLEIASLHSIVVFVGGLTLP